jgi:hypothetical protein
MDELIYGHGEEEGDRYGGGEDVDGYDSRLLLRSGVIYIYKARGEGK